MMLTWSLATRPSILRIFSKVSLSLVRNTSRLEENNYESNYLYLGDLLIMQPGVFQGGDVEETSRELYVIVS